MSDPAPGSAAPAPRASAAWRPLLGGDAAAEALAIAEEIAAGIAATTGGAADLPAAADPRDASLAGGSAGIAVFLAYLEAARPGRGHGDQALRHLERAVEAMGQVDAPPLLFAGFPGVAWALEHLQGRLFESPGEDLGEEAAIQIARHLGQSPWPHHFELIGGAAGLGVYALERLPRPYGEECLRRAVARLAETAERREDGVAWWTPRAWLAPSSAGPGEAGYYNLGVSHGVPGVIAFLGEALAALGPLAPPETRTLLAGAVAWLLAQKLPAGSHSVFPGSVAPGSTPAPTRISWCYGDLGIALALLGAARRAGEPAWEAEALALGRAAAARPFDGSGVVEPGLCHGAAGAAHLFNRLFQASGEPVFAAAARGWIARTYALRRPAGGLAGFSAWLPDADGGLGWRDEPGLLTGAAGVGLALLAAATSIAPAWDRLLLVAVPH
jgi:lantibiotic modifying enzyme